MPQGGVPQPFSGDTRIKRRSQVKLRSLALLVALVLSLAAVGGAAAKTSKEHSTSVMVVAKDFSFTLTPKTVPHGSVTFTIKNEGKTGHDFSIDGHTSKTVGPGKTTHLTAELKAGHWPYKCTVDSHAKLGMKGVLKVT
jgi:plastocyanin